MKPKVSNRQRALRLDPKRMRTLLAFFWACASSGARPKQGRKHLFSGEFDEILLAISDNAGIIRVNRSVFGKSSATDVIALSYPALPGQAAGRAEMFVNVEPALRKAGRRGGPECELALYVAHGCDHLAGGEDYTPEQRRRMLQRERRWVLKAKALGLLAGLRAG